MGKRIVERRLKATSKRLRELRAELEVIDEQLPYLSDEAADLALRAIVSERPLGTDPREAREHAEAMVRHRTRVRDEIQRLEVLLDQLLDQLNRA